MIPASDIRFCGEVTNSGAMAIIAFHGELDLATRPECDALLERAFAHDPLVVAIDLRDLDFLDANGIGALLNCSERCLRTSRRFFLIRGRPEVQGALAAAGVESLFEAVDQLGPVDGDYAGLSA